MWHYQMPQMVTSNTAFPPVNVMQPTAETLTLATVPVPIEGPLQLSHGPPSQVRLEQVCQVSPDEVTSRGHPPNSWVQCSLGSAKPDLPQPEIVQLTCVRQQSATLTRVASKSPTRSGRILDAPSRHSGSKIEKVATQTLCNVERDIKHLPQAVEAQLKRDLVSKEDLREGLQEICAEMRKGFKGVDTSEAAMSALRNAKSTGDLRCAIQRAEETKIPESDVHCFREQLKEEERREQERAEEKVRAEEQRRKEQEAVRSEIEKLKRELEREKNSYKQCSEKLQKEENIKKQMNDTNERLREELKTTKMSESQAQACSAALQQKCTEKEAENLNLKKETSQYHEELKASSHEAKDLRSQIAVLNNQLEQKTSAFTSSQSETRNLRSQLSSAQLNRDAMQKELAKAKQQEQAVAAVKDKENLELRNALQQNEKVKSQIEKARNQSEKAKEEFGNKLYDRDIKLRKANWSCTSNSPAAWKELAVKRELDNNPSGKNTALVKQNNDLQAALNEYEHREHVLWKNIPAENEGRIQHDLKAQTDLKAQAQKLQSVAARRFLN
jgi:hypothetical protein